MGVAEAVEAVDTEVGEPEEAEGELVAAEEVEGGLAGAQVVRVVVVEKVDLEAAAGELGEEKEQAVAEATRRRTFIRITTTTPITSHRCCCRRFRLRPL